jgi:site-specific recombinase XerD
MELSDDELRRLIELARQSPPQKQKKKKAPASKRPPVALSEQELLQVLQLAFARRTRDGVLMLLTYRHGLRPSEALNIRRRDLDGERLTIARGKGSEAVDQPLLGHENPLLDELTWVRRWLAEMGQHGLKGGATAATAKRRAKTLQSSQNVKFQQLSREPGPDDRLFPITRVRYFQIFREYAAAAGIREVKRSPHKLKHSIAKHLVRHGVPLNEVCEWIGWKSMKTADHYTKADGDETAATVERTIGELFK